MTRHARTPADVDAAGARVQRLLDDQVDRGILPSCSAAIAVGGAVEWSGAAGPASATTRYAIFSCSKAFIAATVWQLVDEGRLAFDQPVREFLPDFGIDGSTPEWAAMVSVGHLLTHTAGFPSANLPIDTWASPSARRGEYRRWSCATRPGSSFEYHPVAAHWVLADLIEVVDGGTFAERVTARVTEPIGIAPVFAVPDDRVDDFRRPVAVGSLPTHEEWAAVGIDPASVEPDGSGVDVIEMLSLESARAVGVPGGGGVSTPSDLARFYQALLHNEPELWSRGVLRAGTGVVVDGLTEPMHGGAANRTMGLNVAGDDGFQGFRGYGLEAQTPRAFGHDGAGGQLAFADPDSDVSFSFTTDGMDLHAIRQWRRGRRLVDAVMAPS